MVLVEFVLTESCFLMDGLEDYVLLVRNQPAHRALSSQQVVSSCLNQMNMHHFMKLRLYLADQNTSSVHMMISSLLRVGAWKHFLSPGKVAVPGPLRLVTEKLH